MADVVLDGIRKVYPGGFVAIDHLDLEVRDGEFLVLVGPSGCGKSTALRMIAGLEPITSGECRVGGLRVNDVAPRDRDIAMVFQNYALYPHMTVAENIGFSLKLAGMRRAEVKQRVVEVAEAIELGHLLSSKPGQLSGGQRQRVAMGRAIVRHPKVFLMDEPLSNLDAKLRGQMRAEISKISKNLGVTTIYVTHDQVEAMTMGDRVAVLEAGHLRQINTPQALYDNPANLFVAGFMGSPSMNLMKVVLDRRESSIVVILGTRDLPLPASVTAARPGLGEYLGREVALGVRPEHFIDAREAAGDDVIAATATLVESLGSELLVHFDLDVPSIQVDQDIAAEVGAGGSRIARFDPKSAVRVGSALRVAIDFDRVHFFDIETGEAIRAA